MIHLIRAKGTAEQLKEMMLEHGSYIKLAVDVNRGILAGGGNMHADCEKVLLEDGSQQSDVWGAGWVMGTQEVRYDSLINIRPQEGNRSLLIQDPHLQSRIDRIVRDLLEGVPYA